MIVILRAHCSRCDAIYAERLQAPTRSKINSTILQRRLWMDAHYARSGHYQFMITREDCNDLSVAQVADPNQGRLEDDENYSTFTLRGD